MILLNYAHPLTTDQLAQIAALLGTTPALREVHVQIDRTALLAQTAAALADAAGLSPTE